MEPSDLTRPCPKCGTAPSPHGLAECVMNLRAVVIAARGCLLEGQDAALATALELLELPDASIEVGPDGKPR